MKIADWKIDKEFKSLVPPLTDEERAGLEESIVTEQRVRDPIAIWKGHGIILDGMNRHSIANKHGIKYPIVDVLCADREEAKLWILKNALHRRNLTAFSRTELALATKGVIEEMSAKRRNPEHSSGKAVVRQNSDERRTDETLATLADVSRDTVRKVEAIKDEASPTILSMARQGEVSIDAAAQVSTLTENQQEALAAKGAEAVKKKASAIRSANKRSPKKQTTAPKAQERKLVEVDAVGRPITDQALQEVFSYAADYRSLNAEISRLKAKYIALATGPAGKFAQKHIKEFEVGVDNLHNIVRFVIPHALCVYCGGRGTDDTCRKTGWLPEAIYKAVPKDLKTK